MYRSRTDIPPLVQHAAALAAQRGFELSCITEVGRLLSVLAGSVRHGVVGEIGTGVGVGAAWMLSYLDPTTRLVTVEADAERAAMAQELFKDRPDARVIHGDWRAILAHGPFDLLFVDASEPKRDEPEPVIAALRRGGLVVLDDITPEEQWPENRRGHPDRVRDIWLDDARLHATEVLTTSTTVAIVAMRIA